MGQGIIEAGLFAAVYPEGLRGVELSTLRINMDVHGRYWLTVHQNGGWQGGLIYDPPNIGASLTPLQVTLVRALAAQHAHEKHQRMLQLLEAGFAVLFMGLTIDPAAHQLDVCRKADLSYELVLNSREGRVGAVKLGTPQRPTVTLQETQWKLVVELSAVFD
jgi:hypothetical protein